MNNFARCLRKKRPQRNKRRTWEKFYKFFKKNFSTHFPHPAAQFPFAFPDMASHSLLKKQIPDRLSLESLNFKLEICRMSCKNYPASVVELLVQTSFLKFKIENSEKSENQKSMKSECHFLWYNKIQCLLFTSPFSEAVNFRLGIRRFRFAPPGQRNFEK